MGHCCQHALSIAHRIAVRNAGSMMRFPFSNGHLRQFLLVLSVCWRAWRSRCDAPNREVPRRCPIGSNVTLRESLFFYQLRQQKTLPAHHPIQPLPRSRPAPCRGTLHPPFHGPRTPSSAGVRPHPHSQAPGAVALSWCARNSGRKRGNPCSWLNEFRGFFVRDLSRVVRPTTTQIHIKMSVESTVLLACLRPRWSRRSYSPPRRIAHGRHTSMGLGDSFQFLARHLH